MPLPTFIIVGAQKSGTTTLHDWLGQIAGVWVSDPKELHYFERYQRRSLDWYAAQFTPAPNDVAWGESTPIYLYRDAARRALADSLPNTKLIAILREPVARAYSQYWFARSKGAEPLDTFAAAVAAEPERLRAHRDGQPAKGSYLDRGRYHRQISDLADRVGRDRLQVHLLEDLHTDPVGVLRSTCAFIGLEDAAVDQIELVTKNAFGARTANTAREQRQGIPNADAVPAATTTSYPPIDPTLESELRQRFASDNERLAEWLGRDLSAWS
ncbi:MAG TPA: sulfotransferase domain-containing protein [Actinomycetes bacterium]|nr:sulfotransferase domain-containing protein [Actinomycetes bacterium]